MYRYMHTARLYNNPTEASARPNPVPEVLAEVRQHLDYAAWHSRLTGSNGSVQASVPPTRVDIYQLDYQTWQQRLQAANSGSKQQATVVEIAPAEEPYGEAA
jgi:hypothetical protein